jgi:hypothetical protein
MPADFKVLFRFLEFADGEVHGRQSARPPGEVEKLALALLSGKLGNEKRIELCELLREQPGWLAWFAEQIKKRRKSDGVQKKVSSQV